MTPRTVSDYAKAYTELGFAVLPVHKPQAEGGCSCRKTDCKHPGKHPVAALVPHGFKDATHDLSTAQQYFGNSGHNIAIATGSTSGLVVIDIDGPVGQQSFEKLKADGIDFETAAVKTGRGWHYYFRHPQGIEIQSSSGQLAPGIDVRAEGGMVVAPPSLHASGATYQWAKSQTPERRDIKILPFNLFERLGGAAVTGRLAEQLAPQVNTGFQLPAQVKDGEGREATILRYAGYLRAQGVPQEEIENQVIEYNQNHIHPPLDSDVVLSRARRYANSSISRGTSASMPSANDSEGDIANGIDFANTYRDKLIHVQEQDIWLRFEPQIGWCSTTFTDVEAAAKSVAKSLRIKAILELQKHPEQNGKSKLLARATKAHSLNHMRAMVEMAKSEPGMACSIKDFDSDPMLLGVQNGVLNLRSQQITPPDPGTKVAWRCSVKFDKAADCPRFEAFTQQVLPDADVRHFVQRWAGYCLTGLSSEKIFVMLLGGGDNGKTVLLETLKWLLDSYAAKIETELLMAQPRSAQGPSPEILAIKGKRLIYANETSEGQRLADARVKDLTGGDTLTARPLYGKAPVEFAPTHKLMMVGNHKPVITDTSSGMWSRVVLVPFDVVIPKEARDRHLLTALKSEGSGILNWALAGLAEYQRSGLNVPEQLKAATQAYRQEQDLIGEWVEVHCTSGPSLSCKSQDAYRAFRRWCTDSGHAAPSKTTFTRRLGSAQIKTSPDRRSYLGIELNPEGKRASLSM